MTFPPGREREERERGEREERGERGERREERRERERKERRERDPKSNKRERIFSAHFCDHFLQMICGRGSPEALQTIFPSASPTARVLL